MIKIVFSFDDGRNDNYRLFMQLFVKYNLPSTINITTDYVLKDFDKGIIPCDNTPLSKEMLNHLDNNHLFEIAGHGKQHCNDFQNLLDGVTELRNICSSKIEGIASPCSKLTEKKIIDSKKLFLINGISYIRLGDRIISFILLKKILRKINRIFLHSPLIFTWIYEQTFIDQKDDFILYSVPVLKTDTVSEILALIKRAVKKDKNLILMFHSVLKKGEPEYNSNWSWDWNKFERLIFKVNDMQKQKLLQVTTTQNLMTGN